MQLFPGSPEDSVYLSPENGSGSLYKGWVTLKKNPNPHDKHQRFCRA